MFFMSFFREISFYSISKVIDHLENDIKISQVDTYINNTERLRENNVNKSIALHYIRTNALLIH